MNATSTHEGPTGRDHGGEADGWIYHLCPASELRTGCTAASHTPARLPVDGFVHCAGTPAVTVAVAADYFASLDEDLYVLRIDPAKLTAPVRFEAAAPIEGGGRDHLARADRFPHVYGPIDRVAIVDAGRLERAGSGFAWPERFEPLATVLTSLAR
jgi:uncharacterized protein (DUF952 family)